MAKATDRAEPAESEDATTTSSVKERSTGVQSLERAFSLLEEIARHADGISLADLSKKSGLHNSTAFHLIKTLVTLGYARQSPETKRYHVGRMVYGLAANSLDEIELVSIAMPILEELARSTGESTHIGIRSGSDIIVAARCEAPSVFQLSIRSRGLRPLHCTALGKVLVAALPDAEVGRLTENHYFSSFTPNTITDRDRFRREIETVRSKGVAFDDCEFSMEMRCVAVPVREFTNEVVAAIGLSGPVWRLGFQALTEIAPKVQEAAERLSAELGYRGLDARLLANAPLVTTR